MWPLSRGGLGPWDRSVRARALDLIPWLPTIIGVVTLLALMVVAAVKLRPWAPAPRPLPGPAAPLRVLGPLTHSPTSATLPVSSTGAPVSNTGAPGSSGGGTSGGGANGAGTGTPGSGATTVTPVATPTAGPPRTRPPTSPAGPAARPPSPVTGQYSVLNSYGDSFIGQVLVSNSSGSPQNWTVTLVFPATVGALRTSWLESLPQPTLSHSGETYTWRSSVPLAPGSSGELRFDFSRTGSGNTPLRCVTDGNSCSG